MSPVVQVFVGVASILSICLSQCDMPVGKVQSDKREDKMTLTVANLNAEWLYQDGCRNWNAFLQISKGPAWGTATNWPAGTDAVKITRITNEVDIHIQSVADELARLKADIYVIEEVCDCKTLETVISKMPAANRWMYKAYLKLNTKDHTGTNMAQQTGLITKLQPTAISNTNFQANIKLVPNVNDQKIFRAEFMLNAPGKQFPLILYGVHLPSGGNEAAFNLRKIRLGHVLTAMKNDATHAPNALIIGTGDLNTWKGRKEYVLATYRIASNAGDTRSRYATFETAYNSDRTAPLTIRDIEIEKDTMSPYAGGQVGLPNPAGISNLHWGSKLVKVLYGASSGTAEEHNVRKIEQVKTKCEAAKDGAPTSDAQQYYFALVFTNREKAEDTTLNSIINDPELVLFNDDSYHHATARNKYTHISCDDPEVKNVLDYFFGPASMKKYAMDITKAVKYDHTTAACGHVSDHEAISVEFRLGFLVKDQIHYKKPYSDEPYYFQFKIVLLSIALLSIAVFSILLFCGVMYIFGAICGYFLAIWVKRTQNLMEIGRKQPGIF